MDWSMILGILGIAVSIAVGWLTYRLANRRALSQRYATAKATILQELSKSLGEDSVPAPEVLEATIRSVLREAGDPKVKVLMEDVLDDLIRQVTADPFLDSDRRRRLQADIEGVRQQAAMRSSRVQREEFDAFELRGQLRSTFMPTAVALTTGLLTLTMFLVTSAKAADFDPIAFIRDRPVMLIALSAGSLIALLVPLLLDSDRIVKLADRLFRSNKHRY